MRRPARSVSLSEPRSAGPVLPRAVAMLILGAAVVAWLLCLVPTGLALRDLVMFAAPGAVLWIALGSAVHIVLRRDISWRAVARWALLGGALLPPLLAFLVAVAGLERPTALLSLFTLGAWFTLALGALVGVLYELRRRGDAEHTGSQSPRRPLRRRRRDS